MEVENDNAAKAANCECSCGEKAGKTTKRKYVTEEFHDQFKLFNLYRATGT